MTYPADIAVLVLLVSIVLMLSAMGR